MLLEKQSVRRGGRERREKKRGGERGKKRSRKNSEHKECRKNVERREGSKQVSESFLWVDTNLPFMEAFVGST